MEQGGTIFLRKGRHLIGIDTDEVEIGCAQLRFSLDKWMSLPVRGPLVCNRIEWDFRRLQTCHEQARRFADAEFGMKIAGDIYGRR